MSKFRARFEEAWKLSQRALATLLSLYLLAIAQVGCATHPAPPPGDRTPERDVAGPKEDVPLKPDDAQAFLDHGQALIARGEMAAAVTWLREALRREPDLVQARSSLGLALYGMGDLDGAIDELRALLRSHPDMWQARLNLATALMAKQDWAGAGVELENALRGEPGLLQAYYSLGVVRYTLGDLNGAIEAYRQVLAINPNHGDARYNLGLTLKLAHRDGEATREFLAAAQAGLPRAQYFLGTAYAAGLGVEPNLTEAITWWSRAADQGVVEAEEALAQLRQMALGKGRHAPAERQAVEKAFKEFRSELWKEFPDLAGSGDDSVGPTLLQSGRVREAVPILIREAYALGEEPQRVLETLYEQGVEGQLAPHDPRILSYLRTAAAEGQPRARIELARIYARGLGVPRDVGQAISLLKATPDEDAQRLLQELTAPARDVQPTE